MRNCRTRSNYARLVDWDLTDRKHSRVLKRVNFPPREINSRFIEFNMVDEQGKVAEETTTKSAKAIQLLREVTMLLSDGNTQQEKPERQQQFRHVAHGQIGASTSNVLNNFCSIFAPYNRPPPVPLTSSFQPRRKPLKLKQGGLFFQPKETWTHEFFCLALKNREITPSRAEKNGLQGCGLGRKKICFHSKAQFAGFQEKLEEEYPKLKAGGGFVIMRSGNKGSNNRLAMIPPPASGYSVPFLRDFSGLGQAMAYIRPLQRDLDKNSLSKVSFWLLVLFSLM